MAECDVNNVEMFNEDDYLAAMMENNHKQEDCDNDLSYQFDCSSHDPQECSNEKGKFSTISPLSYIKDAHQLGQVMNVKNVKLHCDKEKGMKIQCLQVDHQILVPHTVPWWLDHKYFHHRQAEEICSSPPKKEPTYKEIGPSSPERELTDKELVPSSPDTKRVITDRELVPSSPNTKREITDKELVPSPPDTEREATDKELVPSPPDTEREATDKELVPSSPDTERGATGKELVPSSPDTEREATDKELVPSSPDTEREATDKGLVPSSPQREPTDRELVPSSPDTKREITDRELVPSSPDIEREATGKELVPSSPDTEREATDKGLVPSSPDIEREATDKGLVPSSPDTEREATDKGLVPSSPDTEREATDKGLVTSSPERETTYEEFSHKNGSIHTPYIIMGTLKSFIWIPLVLVMFSPVSMATNDVNIFSTKTVGIPNDNFDFFCSDSSHTALSVQWLVNGTLLENSRLVNVFQQYNGRSKTGELYFDLPLEHNVTTIQCIYNFASGNVSSETITLLLQGLLSAVGSPSVDLVDTDISLTWTAPFTLDISNVDHDITYCVDVVNSTSSSRVLSECGITVTGFNFSIPVGRVCDNLNISFTVTPVNEAGNGTAVTLGYSQDFSFPRASEELLLPISESTYQITMSAPVCYGELTAINDNTGDEIQIQGSDLSITTNNITFTSENIPKNHFYNVSVNASNINGSAVSSVSLSTHDVMKATFDVTSHTITTEYFEYSTAMGVLYIFIFINEDRSLDFNKSIYLPLDRTSSHNYTLPGISPGQYRMSVYDIDRDVTFYDSVNYPANTDMFSIISDGPQASYSQSPSSKLQDCSVIYVNDVISTMCSYSGGSSVTGFQIIVQLNNFEEVHKLHINSTTEHLSPGPVTVHVNESGKYYVAIFPIMGEIGIVNTNVIHSEMLSVNVDESTTVPTDIEGSSQGVGGTVIGVVVALLITILIVVVVIVVLIGFRKHNRKKHNMFSEDNIYSAAEGGCYGVKDSNATNEHTITTEMSAADPVKPADTEPKQEDQVYRGENVGFYDSEDSISTVQTLQDCGLSVPFMSQWGLSKDLSSSMTTTKTCSTGDTSVTRVHDVKSLHISLKLATNIFNDSNVKLVYVETKFSPDVTCSINDYLDICGETVGEDRHEEKVIHKMKQNIEE